VGADLLIEPGGVAGAEEGPSGLDRVGDEPKTGGDFDGIAEEDSEVIEGSDVGHGELISEM
jgi:hypothetical protein